MFEKLSDNLNLLMTEAHLSADELGRRTGIPASTIKKIRNRYNPNPTLTTLLPLAQFFSITLGQLVGSEPLLSQHQEQSAHAQVSNIPLISWTDAASWPNRLIKPQERILSEHMYSHQAYGLLVEERGWENLAQGTALIVDPTLKVEHRDYVIVLKHGLSVPTLRQALFDDGQLYLKPVIPGYNVIQLTPDHQILGTVVEYKLQLKKAPSTTSY